MHGRFDGSRLPKYLYQYIKLFDTVPSEPVYRDKSGVSDRSIRCPNIAYQLQLDLDRLDHHFRSHPACAPLPLIAVRSFAYIRMTNVRVRVANKILKATKNEWESITICMFAGAKVAFKRNSTNHKATFHENARSSREMLSLIKIMSHFCRNG